MTRITKGRNVAIVGAGPAGLFAAEMIAGAGNCVTIYERMPSPARKFLLAGRGGLNLTNSEPLPSFLARFDDDARELRAAVNAFPPEQLVAWADALGAAMFVGTSGRVFPRAMKASPLLRAWLRRLDGLGITIKTRHRWTGFTPSGGLRFETREGEAIVDSDAALLALGGASWPKLGSDGKWVDIFEAEGIPFNALAPANCGVRIAWSEIFLSRFESVALKRVAISVGAAKARGEAIVTRSGLEGGVVYALVPHIRAELLARGEAALMIDLKPDADPADLARRLSRPRGGDTITNFLRKALHLDAAAIGLLRETEIPEGTAALAARVKAVPLRINGLAGLDRAISTAGGVAWSGLDQNQMILARPGVFVAGEMLDFEAPTGGYLLQGTFATAARAATGILTWLRTRE